MKVSDEFFFQMRLAAMLINPLRDFQMNEALALKQGNSNHHEIFHNKRANISTGQNGWKFVAIFGQDVPIKAAFYSP